MGALLRVLLAVLVAEDLGSHALRRSAHEGDAPGAGPPVEPEALGAASPPPPPRPAAPTVGRGASALLEAGARAGASFPAARLAPLLLTSDPAASGAGSLPGGGLHIPTGDHLPWAAGVRSHGAHRSGGLGPLRAVDMMERPDDDEEEPARVDLTPVDAFDPISMDPVPVSLPTAWVDNLNLAQLFRVYGDWTSSMFTATAKHSLALKMRIEVVSSKDPATRRGLKVIQRLDSWRQSGLISGGNIISVFGTQVSSDLTYILYEGEHMTLDRLLSDKVFGLFDTLAAESETWQPAMPLSLSLPLIVDLLRGAKDLEAADIIHSQISPFTVMIVDKLRGAITGLHLVCFDSGSKMSGRPSLKDDVEGSSVTSPFWQPPEAKEGVPKDKSVHVWSIGMIFATMCFGSNPSEAVLTQVWPAGVPDMYFPKARQEVREIIAERFDIAKAEDFEDIGEDLQEVLRGMLHVAPEQRWSTELALAKLEALSEKRRVKLPLPRFRPFLPGEWKNVDEISGPVPQASSTSTASGGEDMDGVDGPWSFAGIKDTGVLYESDGGDEWQ